MTTMASVGFKNPEHGTKLAEANSQFALDMFRALSVKEKGNIFFSPGSISVALAMTYLGAKNNTAKEMKSVMSLEQLEDDHLHSAFGDLLRIVTDTDGNYTLMIANRLFMEKTYTFLQDFLDKQQDYYKATLANVDFIKKFEEARLEINSWVESKTANKIKDLLPDGSLDNLTRMVLVNAIYFKGDWANKFQKSKTSQEDFWLNENDKVKVDMMHQKAHFNYGLSREWNDCKILELPYKGDKLSMFILLPSKTDGLAHIESQLTAKHLRDPIRTFKMRRVEVQVSLPKFKLEQSFDLGDTLSAMGMKDLFVPDADLSGIETTRELHVSKVVHKAFLLLDEYGTEATAATAVISRKKRRAVLLEDFIVDRPFLILINDKLTDTTLFIGRITNPDVKTNFPKDEL